MPHVSKRFYLFSPGQKVQKGQAVTMMTSPDLAGLRVEALD